MKKLLEEKFNTKFKGKIDPFKYFFGHVIREIETEDALDEYAVHNFSGDHSMSNINSVTPTKNFILAEYPQGTHLDIGASRGLLSRLLLENGMDSYALDGSTYGLKTDQIEIPLSRYVVCDMVSFGLDKLDFEKYFDISTAFEITEHIHEKDIKRFYDNVSYMSKEHICSVHINGEDSTTSAHTNHHNVKPLSWWVEFLGSYGTVTQVDELRPVPVSGTRLYVPPTARDDARAATWRLNAMGGPPVGGPPVNRVIDALLGQAARLAAESGYTVDDNQSNISAVFDGWPYDDQRPYHPVHGTAAANTHPGYLFNSNGRPMPVYAVPAGDWGESEFLKVVFH